MVQDLVLSLAISVGAALVYGTSFYYKNRERAGDPIQPRKFAATLLVALGIGIVGWRSGLPISEEYVLTALAANAGLIAVVESLIKGLYAQLAGAQSGAGGSGGDGGASGGRRDGGALEADGGTDEPAPAEEGAAGDDRRVVRRSTQPAR